MAISMRPPGGSGGEVLDDVSLGILDLHLESDATFPKDGSLPRDDSFNSETDLRNAATASEAVPTLAFFERDVDKGIKSQSFPIDVALKLPVLPTLEPDSSAVTDEYTPEPSDTNDALRFRDVFDDIFDKERFRDFFDDLFGKERCLNEGSGELGGDSSVGSRLNVVSRRRLGFFAILPSVLFRFTTGISVLQ